MKTSDRSPKSNALALLVVGLVALVGGGAAQNVVLIIIGVAALVGASHYLKVATDQAKASEGNSVEGTPEGPEDRA